MVETNTLVLSATIFSGESISGEIDLSAFALNKDNYRAFAIVPPKSFTGSITFMSLVSEEYHNIRDALKAEYVIQAEDGDDLSSEYIPLDPVPFSAISNMKIRYGTAGVPVVAATDMVFKIVVRLY